MHCISEADGHFGKLQISCSSMKDWISYSACSFEHACNEMTANSVKHVTASWLNLPLSHCDHKWESVLLYLQHFSDPTGSNLHVSDINFLKDTDKNFAGEIKPFL